MKKPIDKLTDTDFPYHSISEKEFANWSLAKQVHYCFDNFDATYIKVKKNEYRVNLYESNRTDKGEKFKLAQGVRMKVMDISNSENSHSLMAKVNVLNACGRAIDTGWVSLVSPNLEFECYRKNCQTVYWDTFHEKWYEKSGYNF